MKNIKTFFIVTFLIICGSLPAYAGSNVPAKSLTSSIQVIKPSNDYYITTNDNIVISGKGKEGNKTAYKNL